MAQSSKLFKNNQKDKIYWLDNGEEVKGEFVFTFDGKKFYNLFADYPEKLSMEEKRIFDAENPFWKDFFSDRQG